MRTLRARPSLAVLCAALAVLTGFVATPDSGACLLVAIFLFAPAVVVAVVRRTDARPDEQPLALLALLPSRAPPFAPAFA